MISEPKGPEALTVDRDSTIPLFRQIYDRTRAAIAAGCLRPGERLPSARSLAAQLGAARGTVETAYAMLSGEGWIVARGAAGTVVAPQLGVWPRTSPAPPQSARPPVPRPGVGAMPASFRMGLPALDLLSFTNVPEAHAAAAARALFEAIGDRLTPR